MDKIIVNNPAMDYFLAKFRDKETDTYECERCVENLSFFLAGEVSKYLSTENRTIVTPLGVKDCAVINEEVVLVPVLRAGVSMLSSFRRILPQSKVAFLWAHRDEECHAVIDKYKFPKHDGEIDVEGKTVIVLDTMLATAGTINSCADLISEYNPKQIIQASILSTEIGMNNVSDKYAAIITASLADTLDDRLYIYPGVGDSGDRLYG